MPDETVIADVNGKMTLETVIRFMDEVEFKTDWVSPDWEPVVKTPEDRRKLFLFGLHLMALTLPKELGVATVHWSKCDKERNFTAETIEER